MAVAKRSRLARIARTEPAIRIRRALSKARLVEDPLRFLVLESAVPGRIADHRLTGLPLTISVRHRTRDTDILGEMLTAYRPPPSIELPRAGTVLDIGANIGLFALWALERCPGCEVVSYEPDPGNFKLLERNRRRASARTRWAARAAAVGTCARDVRFASGAFADSRVSARGDVVVPMVDIFEQPRADFMKIDIEGSEWEILRDRRLPDLPAQIVVVEWHRHAPDGTEGDQDEAARRLSAAGFRIDSSAYEAGRDHGVIWASRN